MDIGMERCSDKVKANRASNGLYDGTMLLGCMFLGHHHNVQFLNSGQGSKKFLYCARNRRFENLYYYMVIFMIFIPALRIPKSVSRLFFVSRHGNMSEGEG